MSKYGTLPPLAQKTVRVVTKPLLVSATSSSLLGAGSTVYATHALSSSSLQFFVAMTLFATIAQAAFRAAVYDGFLVRRRLSASAWLPVLHGLTFAMMAAIALGLYVKLVLRFDLMTAVLTGIAVSTVIIADLGRYRLLAIGTLQPIATADLVRLLLVAASVVIERPSDAASLFVAVYWTGLPAAAITILASRQVMPRQTWRPYIRVGAPLLGDFMVSQLVSNIPLLVLGGIGSGALFTGVRVAQTLLGPLNLLYSSSVSELGSRAVTSHATSEITITHARLLGRRLLAASATYAAIVLALVLVVPQSGIAVDRVSLSAGVIVVGATLALSGWTGIWVYCLKLLGRGGSVLLTRVIVLVFVAVAYAVGFAYRGADAAILAGLAANALLAPTMFTILRRRTLHATRPL